MDNETEAAIWRSLEPITVDSLIINEDYGLRLKRRLRTRFKEALSGEDVH